MRKRNCQQKLDKFRKGDLIKIKNFKNIGVVVSLKFYLIPGFETGWVELTCFVANKFLVFKQSIEIFLKYCQKKYFKNLNKEKI